jgi:DNA uptake protein ComE-like DNA-binding protein
MATKLSKAEFETLPDALKAKFKAEGDDAYVLIEEDVEGLKKNKAELLKELKELRERFGDLDPDAARKAMELAAAAEDEKLRAAGEFDKLKSQLEERHKAEVEKARNDLNGLLASLKRERLTNVLTEKGVLPDRAKYLVHELDKEVELVNDANGFQLRKVGGIGDAVEFDAMIENVKQTSPFFFAATTASGSGASGSSNNGQSNAKAMVRTAFDGLDPNAKQAFIREGGTVTD